MTCQQLTNRVVGDMSGCAVYLDDVMMYCDTWEEHVEHIHELLLGGGEVYRQPHKV